MLFTVLKYLSGEVRKGGIKMHFKYSFKVSKLKKSGIMEELGAKLKMPLEALQNKKSIEVTSFNLLKISIFSFF